MEDKNKKDLEIVSGDDSNLDISPVYDHLNTAKPKSKKPRNIVIPKEKPEKENLEDEKDNNSDNSDEGENDE